MNIVGIMIIVGLLIAAPWQAVANITIFACEPEWASLAKKIGKDKVNIKTATNALTDPHHIRARPSLIAAIRQSDLVFCSGSELEVGWLPLLLEKAKASVQPGKIGYLMASDYVTRLEVPEQLDRAHGDIHPGGNPHVHLNPHHMLVITPQLTKRLKQIDSNNASFYQQHSDAFMVAWQAAIKQWELKARPLNNMPIVVHHKNWVYLSDWLNLRPIATLEPKPGIPPSAAHLENLLSVLATDRAKAIIRAPYEDPDPSLWLANKTQIPAIELPFTVDGNHQATDLFSLFDNTINTLLKVNQANDH